MDKIQVVTALVEIIEEEKVKIARYREAREYAFKTAEITDSRFYECFHWDEPVPSNVKIKDACKMARMLLLEIAKDLKPINL